MRSVRYAYPRSKDAVLAGFSWRFEPGSLTAITGRSGVGKSTLLYLLGLLLTPDDGVVVFDGQTASAMDDLQRSRFRAEDVGFVFQDAALDPRKTIVQNVLEAAVYLTGPIDWATARERAATLLDHFQVQLRHDRLPGQVSGGQAQRVGLCRALHKRPRLLLADEPTGNLDPKSARVVLETLSQASSQGATVVISSHDPDVTSIADEVVRL